MTVQLTAEIEAKLDQWTYETGRTKDDFVQDALAGYFDQLAQVRESLDRRYDEVRSGRVKLVPADDVVQRLREKRNAWRT